ncbi:MAG: hypothetical protein NT038_10185 [Euryarchaeota archaeon]|nr:hypothetical protein [Euryarchaeota archaeon]
MKIKILSEVIITTFLILIVPSISAVQLNTNGKNIASNMSNKIHTTDIPINRIIQKIKDSNPSDGLIQVFLKELLYFILTIFGMIFYLI